MSSSPLIAGALVIMLLTAGCTGVFQTPETGQTSLSGSEGESPTISVSASGQVTTDPDLAIVRVAVIARAPTADEARQLVANDANQMRNALFDIGVTEDGLRTTQFSIFPEYRQVRDENPEIIGYRAIHAYEIETGVSEAGTVIDTAVSSGADQVNGVQFTLQDETRRDLRANAIQNAMMNARADADAIANAGNVRITGIHSASISSGGFIPVERTAADSAAGQTTIDPGPVTVTVSVHVTYSFT